MLKSGHLEVTSKIDIFDPYDPKFVKKLIFAQMTRFQHDLSLQVLNLFQWFLMQKSSTFYEKLVRQHLVNI